MPGASVRHRSVGARGGCLSRIAVVALGEHRRRLGARLETRPVMMKTQAKIDRAANKTMKRAGKAMRKVGRKIKRAGKRAGKAMGV